jgi:drug/metabolite transporter (DMT)-like permease
MLNKAHLALFIVSALYGANYLIAKGVMPAWIVPSAFVTLRVTGALVLFGLPALLLREKIKRKDYLRLAFCGLFGVAVNQMFFFEGLSRTSAMNSAILMTLNPILVLLLAVPILKEKLNVKSVSGIVLGAAGAIGVITMSNMYSPGYTSLKGDVFILINALSYALYLVLVKPLMQRYKPITVAAWVFCFGALYVLPYGGQSVLNTNFSVIPQNIWMSVLYVVLGTTFLAYLLNIYALVRVSPSVVSAYIYLQPVFALVSVILFSNQGTKAAEWYHLVFGILIFAGVYLVSIRNKK